MSDGESDSNTESQNETAESGLSLYDRVGGEAGIARLIDAFYSRVLADEELRPYFEHSPMDALRRMQGEFFSAALGGSEVYSGKTLRQAHQGRGITREHFGRFVGHLLDTLKGFDLSEKESDDIISRVNLYADEVVGSPGGVDG